MPCLRSKPSPDVGVSNNLQTNGYPWLTLAPFVTPHRSSPKLIAPTFAHVRLRSLSNRSPLTHNRYGHSQTRVTQSAVFDFWLVHPGIRSRSRDSRETAEPSCSSYTVLVIGSQVQAQSADKLQSIRRQLSRSAVPNMEADGQTSDKCQKGDRCFNSLLNFN